MVERVSIDQMRPAIVRTLNELSRKNAVVVGRKAADMPRRFVVAATAFYPGVLRVRTGRLKKSFEAVGRKSGDGRFTAGLRSRVEYAAAQHWGFHGTVNVKPHLRKVGIRSIKTGRRQKRAGKTGVEQITRVRGHKREMDIKPKYFFRDPMIQEAGKIVNELKKEIGF